mmetsp:Transcript_99304/g.309419  ORF Transcript_99304/g.309419 Transcript_99304/m.309419 type:complete len:292 (+) Transcript_99304:472-1347(+)
MAPRAAARAAVARPTGSVETRAPATVSTPARPPAPPPPQIAALLCHRSPRNLIHIVVHQLWVLRYLLHLSVRFTLHFRLVGDAILLDDRANGAPGHDGVNVLEIFLIEVPHLTRDPVVRVVSRVPPDLEGAGPSGLRSEPLQRGRLEEEALLGILHVPHPLVQPRRTAAAHGPTLDAEKVHGLPRAELVALLGAHGVLLVREKREAAEAEPRTVHLVHAIQVAEGLTIQRKLDVEAPELLKPAMVEASVVSFSGTGGTLAEGHIIAGRGGAGEEPAADALPGRAWPVPLAP